MTTRFHLHKARLETLVDGVFAIAMTILVLEVKVPALQDKTSASELLHALLHDGIVIFAYFVSFSALGIFWVWHHKMMEKVRHISLSMLVCSLIFLALICFFPFVAAMFGRYPLNLTANIVYVALLGLVLYSQTLFFYLALRDGNLHSELKQSDGLRSHSINLLSLAVYCFTLSATGLRLSWLAGLACIGAGLLLLWRYRRLQRQIKSTEQHGC